MTLERRELLDATCALARLSGLREDVRGTFSWMGHHSDVTPGSYLLDLEDKTLKILVTNVRFMNGRLRADFAQDSS